MNAGIMFQEVCSARGYNQLLLSSDVNNAIEDSFSKVETHLPETFKALEGAANKPSIELPKAIYRLQFERLLHLNFVESLNCEWTVSNSPVELPMPDIGLVQIQLTDLQAVQ